MTGPRMRNNLTRRRLLKLGTYTAAGLAAFGLAACAPSAPASAPGTPTSAGSAPSVSATATTAPAQTAAPSGGPTEIIFWPRDASEGNVVWAKILPIAKQMFPQLTVTFQAPASDFDNKLLVAYAGGTAPDSGVTGLSAFRPFIGKQVFKSIQSYVDADADVKQTLQTNYVPAAIKGYSLAGKLYGAPTVNEAIVLWYNKDAIVGAGLTPPRDIQDDPAKWNWNTVVTYAKAINKGTGFHRERYGIITTSARGTSGMSEAWGNLVYANGGRVLDDQGENWVFNGPNVHDALQWVVDLTFKYDVQPSVSESASAGLRDRAFFQNNQVGMVVQGEYFGRYLWGSGKPSGGIPFGYDLAPMPFCPATGKRTNIYHGNACFMVSQTKHPDATFDWLKVTLTQEAQQIITQNWGARAADARTYDQWLKTNAGGGPPGVNYDAIIKADKDTDPYPTTPYLTPDALFVPTVRLLYDNVFLNKMTVQEGLDQDATETKALIDKAKAEAGAKA